MYGTIPSNSKSGYIDLTKMAAISLWVSTLPLKSTSYESEGLNMNSCVEEIIEGKAYFYDYPYINIRKSGKDYIFTSVYNNICINPKPYVDISTREMKIGLQYNRGDGLVDKYITSGNTYTYQLSIYTIQ